MLVVHDWYWPVFDYLLANVAPGASGETVVQIEPSDNLAMVGFYFGHHVPALTWPINRPPLGRRRRPLQNMRVAIVADLRPL